MFSQANSLNNRLRLPSSDRRGAAVVEAAIVLPVFFLVVMGIIEFGRAMMASQIITNAAREGAREAILNGSTNADVISVVEDFVSKTCRVDKKHVTVNVTVAVGAGNTDPKNILLNSNEGDLVTVQVLVPFSELSYITGKYLEGLNMNAQSTMRHE